MLIAGNVKLNGLVIRPRHRTNKMRAYAIIIARGIIQQLSNIQTFGRALHYPNILNAIPFYYTLTVSNLW